MITLHRRHIEEIIEHANSEKPDEACGLIAGVGGRAIKVYRGTNVDENRRVRYFMEPKEILKAMRDIDDNDWELLATYHSHPQSQAYPSQTDVAMAFYPNSYYIIASLLDPERPIVRAFRIVDNKITEVEIRIVSDDD